MDVALKRSKREAGDPLTDRQFIKEQQAYEHSWRVGNPFALQLLCPMAVIHSRYFLAMEYVPSGDLYNYVAALEDYSRHVRARGKPHYPHYEGVHVAVARFVAAQFMLFFDYAGLTAPAEAGVQDSEEIGPFIAWDIKLENVLITADGGIKVGGEWVGLPNPEYGQYNCGPGLRLRVRPHLRAGPGPDQGPRRCGRGSAKRLP